MTNYESFLNLLNIYCIRNNLTVKIESTMKDVSLDSSKGIEKEFISEYKNLNVISMDDIAHDVVRKLKFSDSKWYKDSPASVDAFLIDENNKWYFIEFKNQKISNAKIKCVEKSYANLYWLFDIFYEMHNNGFDINFNYGAPNDFIKNNCEFILVIYNDSDPLQINKIREAKKANLPMPEGTEFLLKLENYVFKKARVMDVDQFDRDFVRKFKY